MARRSSIKGATKALFARSTQLKTRGCCVALDQALASQDSSILRIKSDPYFKVMHADRRYTALLQKVGLPE
jgi:hypothetical protein